MSGGTKRRRMLPSLSLLDDSGSRDVLPGEETAETASSCSSLFAADDESCEKTVKRSPSLGSLSSLGSLASVPAEPTDMISASVPNGQRQDSCSFSFSCKLALDGKGCEKTAQRSLSLGSLSSLGSDGKGCEKTAQRSLSLGSLSSLGSIVSVSVQSSREALRLKAVTGKETPRKTASTATTAREPLGRCDWPAGKSWLYYDIPGYAYKLFDDGACHLVVTDGYNRPSRTERLVVACAVVAPNRTQAQARELKKFIETVQDLGFFIEFFQVLLWGLEKYHLFTQKLPTQRVLLKEVPIPFYPIDLEIYRARKAEEEAKKAARASGTDIMAETQVLHEGVASSQKRNKLCEEGAGGKDSTTFLPSHMPALRAPAHAEGSEGSDDSDDSNSTCSTYMSSLCF